MKTKFSLSALILMVLFTANLSTRLHNRIIKVSFTFTQFEDSESKVEDISLLSPPVYTREVFQKASVLSYYPAQVHFIERNIIQNPSLSYLYLGQAPPA